MTLREKCKLRVFENRALTKIFGLRRDREMGGWRKLHNEELDYLYSSPNIIRTIKLRRMRWAVHVVGKSEGKRLLGKPRHRWIDITLRWTF
jgi:hypothetical protein